MPCLCNYLRLYLGGEGGSGPHPTPFEMGVIHQGRKEASLYTPPHEHTEVCRSVETASGGQKISVLVGACGRLTQLVTGAD